ncbi:MAG: pyrrolo-quinoline quinone [Planctomycetaceae bacterium]|nr:pyrrolo-quinoline quinone [Planctomycetaceae bacterium]
MISRRVMSLSCLLLTLAVYWQSSLLAENWPSWRGPTGNGISTEKGLPTEWSASKNVAWRIKLPGQGGATPAVWDNHIFVTAVDDNELVLLAFDISGKQLWREVLATGDKKVRGDEGNAASPSPVTDGKHVWAMMANGALACYDFKGNKTWSQDLQELFGRFRIAFGMTSSPVLHDGRLFLQLIHGDGQASTQEALVAALDAGNGKELWRQYRVTKARAENEHSYASPILYQDATQTYLVTHGADFAIAYALKDGKEIWRLGGLNPHEDPKRPYHSTLRFVASPAAVPGMIVVPTAKNGPVFAIKADGKGDLTGNESVHHWIRPKNTPDVPSPLIHEGLVYLCRESGDLICMEADSGEQHYLERTHRIRHRASPVYADGHIYLAGRDGKVSVVKAGRDFKLVSQNEIGDDVSASLAVSNGTIYIRSYNYLWAIRN